MPHVFAIGDVVGQPTLAYKATHQGKEDIGLTIQPHLTLVETLGLVAEAFAGTRPDVRIMAQPKSQARGRMERGLGMGGNLVANVLPIYRAERWMVGTFADRPIRISTRDHKDLYYCSAIAVGTMLAIAAAPTSGVVAPPTRRASAWAIRQLEPNFSVN